MLFLTYSSHALLLLFICNILSCKIIFFYIALLAMPIVIQISGEHALMREDDHGNKPLEARTP